MTFGADVRARRHELGLTQVALAERSGVSRPTIARLEAGADVSTLTLGRVVEALGLQVLLRETAAAQRAPE